MTDETEALDALRAEVAVGWKVKITNHDYINDSRDDVTVTEVTPEGLTLTPKRPWSSQGRAFRTASFTWREDPGVQRVTDRTVQLYSLGTAITSRTTPGRRRVIKTYVFSPPSPY